MSIKYLKIKAIIYSDHRINQIVKIVDINPVNNKTTPYDRRTHH